MKPSELASVRAS